MKSVTTIVFLLAAGSHARPQGNAAPSSSSPTPLRDSTTAGPNCGPASQWYQPGPNCENLLFPNDPNSNPQSSSAGSGNSTQSSSVVVSQPSLSPISSQPGAPLNASGVGSGKCPQGFRNVVFNTGAAKLPGWPGAIWSSLVSHGVSNWIGFSLNTLDKQRTYNTATGSASTNAALDQGQVHIVMDPTYIDDALALLKSDPPRYLELFNEPDFSYNGWTPLTDAVTAATKLQPFFEASHPSTTYISPALMNANSDWLTTFRDHCNNCFAQIPVITAHLYNTDPNYILDQVKQLHSTFPDQKIWITELAPATSACPMSAQDMVNWMNTLIPQLVALGYVEKIFWNSGEAGLGSDGLPDGGCNPSLTNPDGSPTQLLSAYGQICS